MLTRIIEATNEEKNWGKFLLGWFTEQEWEVRSSVDNNSVLGGRGLTRRHLLVTDLQTGEGCIFRLGGYAKADLNKHAIWVCPLFEPFLAWLYEQKLDTISDFEALPAMVKFTLAEAEFQMSGYRRQPDIDAIKQEAREEGEETVTSDLAEFAERVMGDGVAMFPAQHILSDLIDGEWMEKLESMRAEEAASKEPEAAAT